MSARTRAILREMRYALSNDVAEAVQRERATMLEHLLGSGFSAADADAILQTQLDQQLPGYRGLDKLAFAQRTLSQMRRNFRAEGRVNNG